MLKAVSGSTLPDQTGHAGQFLTTDGTVPSWTSNAGGDVVGPSSSVDGEIALFNGITGKAIKSATGTGYAKVINGVLQTPSATIPNTDITGLGTMSTQNANAVTITGGTISGLASPIASASGGTGNGFTKFSGPTASEKTFTLPNASATILTDNTVITPTQGGTGIANNAASTLTISGNFATTLTVTGITSVTLPTTGTLVNTAVTTLSSLVSVGTLTTAVWNATNIDLAHGGSNASLTANTGGIVYSTASAMAILSGTATAGKMLQSGATAAPTWSTPTYPSASGTSGKFLISDGTNNVYSTSTIPTSAGATANKILLSDGTNYVLSTPTYPNASATSGKIIISDGTNWISSTPTYPNTSGTAGKIIRSDGTNNVYSTATFADTYTASNLLYSNGASAVTGLATAANGLLTTDGSGVPSITASIPSVTNITFTGNNGFLGTGTSDGNNIGLVGYDIDQATYRAFLVLTAHNVPTMAITGPIGGTSTMDNVVIGGSTAVAGTFTTVTSTTLTNTISTAGSTVTTTTSNTNNSNAASNATVQVTTGGASAGDPKMTFTITSATSWSYGADNSDSDSLKENPSTSLGSGDTRVVLTTGEQTMPLQTAFLGYLGVTATDVTGDGTVYTVAFDSEVYDQNSDFNTSTATFTAPVTAKIQLGSNLVLGGLTSSHTSLIIIIVTSNRSYQVFAGNGANIKNAGNNAILGGAVWADMDAADTATVTIAVSGGTKVADILGGSQNTNFYGGIVC